MTQRSVHNNRAGHISFFGGEPLLPENTEINKKILQYARKHGFSCDITTNGTTIKDVHVATLLRENHDLIKSIQISIDGTKEYHDNMKFTVDGCGTFDLVMENILSLLRMGKESHFSTTKETHPPFSFEGKLYYKHNLYVQSKKTY